MHADLRLSVDASSPRQARSFVAEQLRDWHYDEETVEIVELLTSELVTNVFRHANGPSDLTVDADGSGVRVGVSDLEEAGPIRRFQPPTAESGHGIAIVEALASRWGVDAHPSGGKTVWFRAAPDAAPPDLTAWLDVGDPVEVYSAFNHAWAPGFRVAGIVGDGYQLCRSSDGSLLPGPTSREDLRPEPPPAHPVPG
jgi:anti-sigma regulatory factor (Ser/Thr protein kinase)